MTSSARITLAALALSCATALSAPAAHALTAKECHQSFAAARTAGTLNGKSYKEFKAATCDAPASAATTAPAASAPKETAPATAPAATTGTTPTETAKPATTPVSSGGVIFPSAVASQYANLSAGKGRMKTCLDQYNANKTSGGNGSLKWIQKGGGYYSQCNTRLKGG
ncbi:hypothetical protein AD947_13220 [Acetobacter tropicalis]|uniref:Uncharacterized protein n=1 Tax=Acetobacter tropicalis TaxID=104102 RepID=A0A149TSA0_9PROT|nr:hypothetical protein [Acetobacter tropicalis]KXV56008.1 hypothetical protein AD947_13220 [Acetobacter tropicalis]